MSMLENGEEFVGILYKRGKFNKSFKERWFRVNRKTQIMDYYENEEKSVSFQNSLGHIDLAICKRIEVNTTDKKFDNDSLPEFITYNLLNSEKKSFSFNIVSPQRTFTLAAISEIDLFKWLQFLSICVYGAVIKQGYVKKQEGATAISKAWKKRYAVLNEYRQLKWYQDHNRNGYLGFIDCNTLSSISNGKTIASELGYILDLYTKYGNVWYVGCKDELERDNWNKHLTSLLPKRQPKSSTYNIDNDDQKGGGGGKSNVFGNNLIYEEECKSINKCHSISRMIKCLHIWNGNGDSVTINKILSQNKHFVRDYNHILNIHLDDRNDFDKLYKFVISQIRHIDLTQNNDLSLPDESQQNTFYENAMHIYNCYFFGDLV